MECEASRDAKPTGSSAAAEPERFTLRNDPPKLKPATFANAGAGRQGVLLDGLDCLPGQADLF